MPEACLECWMKGWVGDGLSLVRGRGVLKCGPSGATCQAGHQHWTH